MTKVMFSKGSFWCEAELNRARRNGGIQLSRLQSGDRVILYFDSPEKNDFMVINVYDGEHGRMYFIAARGSVNLWLHMREHIGGCTFNERSSSLITDWLYLDHCPVMGPWTLPPVKHIYYNGVDIAKAPGESVH